MSSRPTHATTVAVAAAKAGFSPATGYRIEADPRLPSAEEGPTLALARATADPTHAGLRHFDRVVAVGGGVPIEARGSILGALGVSGGPGGEVDDRCARSGLDAIRSDLEF